MEDNKTAKNGGVRKKLFLLCTIMLITTSATFALIDVFELRVLMKVATETNKSQNETIKRRSEEALTRLTYENMQNTISLAARNVDGEFWTMRHDFTILARQVKDVFDHPDKYGEREVHGPDPGKKGEYTLQLLFAKEETARDADTMTMVGKLASLEPIMAEIVRGNNNYTRDCYISLPNGTTLAMDTISNEKFDEKGNVYPYDPTVRPWYTSAVEKGEFCFTLAVHSYFFELPEVEYGYPIYKDGKLVAVLQGSTKLSTLQKFASDVSVGENGFSIMISGDGQLVYSPRESGELEMIDDLSSDLRNIDNESLRQLIHEALDQETGLGEADIDGEKYHAAYARMDSLGWTLITFVPQKELEEPTEKLLSEVDAVAEKGNSHYIDSIRRATVILLLILIPLIIGAFLATAAVSGRITNPLRIMTKNIENTAGKQFIFEMEDVYRSGDEIEILAHTFKKVSDQMEGFLDHILTMMAEKERVNTELNLATRIQKDNLPNTFPAFPDRHEFDIYASMNPAREVGGDFYDYFLVDDDHLAMVMADVSDKGVPAAMLMMKAKTMIQTQASKGLSPKQVFETTNQLLCENNNEKMFVTAWLGILNLKTGLLTAANAGHEFPVLKMPHGSFEIIKDKHCFVLGGMRRMKYVEYEMQIPPGSKLFVYTDGVPEAMNPDREQFGMERTLQALNKVKDETPEIILKSVYEDVESFVAGQEVHDDITMLCIEYLGEEV